MKNIKQNKIRIIGGRWRSRVIPVLEINQLRPSPSRVRETLFNWLGQKLTNCTCIDLFAGSGILGFEAASREAERVIMIEKNKLIYQQLTKSAKLLGTDSVDIILGDSIYISEQLPKNHFDIAFIDPPFQSHILPDAITQATTLVKKHGTLYIEAPKQLEQYFKIHNKIWQCTHKGKAGKVFYHLFRSTN